MTAIDDSLMAEATRRLADLAEVSPELRPAIELQRRLLAEVLTTLRRLRQNGPFILSVDPGAAVEKLRRGLPALRDLSIDVPVMLLAPSLGALCEHLADGGAGDVARRLFDTLESGRMSRASLLTASLARNQHAIRSGATQLGLSPDLVWLVGELAASPFAHLLQERLFAPDHSGDHSELVRSALAAWDRGYCPACGSWPALAEYVNNVRLLRCSFCAATWEMHSYRCVYCGNDDARFVTTAPDSERPHRLLELCGHCAGYTKTIQVQTPVRFPLLAIEDLETLEMDRVAINRGYGRPPLIELGKSGELGT